MTINRISAAKKVHLTSGGQSLVNSVKTAKAAATSAAMPAVTPSTDSLLSLKLPYAARVYAKAFRHTAVANQAGKMASPTSVARRHRASEGMKRTEAAALDLVSLPARTIPSGSLPFVALAEQERRDVGDAGGLRDPEGRGAADGEGREADARGEQAVEHALAHPG
jgi:hypothetical protein